MSTEHKAAMEAGRAEGRVVRDYLEALRTTRPKRGRKRTSESIEKRLAVIDNELPHVGAIEELKLVQERRDLLSELSLMNDAIDISQLESAFISVAKDYGDRKGISYASWREVGVSASVLRSAGIGRSS